MVSAEEREAHWRRHLQSQYLDYEAFDRNLSDKVSISRGTSEGLKLGQGKEKAKEGKDKKAKKEKKEKKEEKKEKDAAPKKVTVLGARAPAQEVEEAIGNTDAEATTEERPEMPGNSEQQEQQERLVEQSPEPKPREVRRSADLSWADLCQYTRRLLLQSGRLSSDEFLERWEAAHGYPLLFPIFGIADLQEFIKRMQPGMVAVVARSGLVIQASTDNAFAKEQQRWKEAYTPMELERNATEWLLATLEAELKALRQGIKERRMAEKAARTQVEPLRQEYKALQANQKGGKSAQIRSTKLDLDKAEQRMQKFAAEAEEREAQEQRVLARIVEVQKSSDEAPLQEKREEKDVVETKAAPIAAEVQPLELEEPEDGPDPAEAEEAPQAPVGTTGYAMSVEEDFM
mmetsp:Transcript_50566/g.118080  ORF Transcript_50566/g.118080 Transcript_50566/m.118080 type:complete len:402 (-) Transcript_50566:132-1337(-)